MPPPPRHPRAEAPLCRAGRTLRGWEKATPTACNLHPHAHTPAAARARPGMAMVCTAPATRPPRGLARRQQSIMAAALQEAGGAAARTEGGNAPCDSRRSSSGSEPGAGRTAQPQCSTVDREQGEGEAPDGLRPSAANTRHSAAATEPTPARSTAPSPRTKVRAGPVPTVSTGNAGLHASGPCTAAAPAGRHPRARSSSQGPSPTLPGFGRLRPTPRYAFQHTKEQVVHAAAVLLLYTTPEPSVGPTQHRTTACSSQQCSSATGV